MVYEISSIKLDSQNVQKKEQDYNMKKLIHQIIATDCNIRVSSFDSVSCFLSIKSYY